MNKLVSKNPVLRFKLGLKILKFYGGGQPWAGYYTVGNLPTNNKLKRIHSSKPVSNSQTIAPDGSYYEKTVNGKVVERGRWLNGKTIPIKNNKKFVKREYIDPNGNLFKWNEDENGNYISGQIVDQTNGNVYWRGSDGSMTLIRKGNINKPEGKKPVITNRVLPKYSGVDLLGKTVSEWQNILKDYYAPGTKKKYMEDGIWGDATDDAYRRYLTIANTDFTPVSKEPIEIPNNEDNNVNFDYEKFKRAALASDYTPDLIEQKLVSTPVTYNRSMTRDWLRNNIGTAYGVSGAMRAATRRKLNGLATDDDITLIKSNLKLYDALKNAGLFKKGGQLVSRNPVKRFKIRKGLLGLISALLPKKNKNIKKSKDDFGNDVVTTTIENRGKNPFKTGEIISLEVTYNKENPEYNDTVYTYLPQQYISLNPKYEISDNWKTAGVSLRRPLFERLRNIFNNLNGTSKFKNFRLVAQ